MENRHKRSTINASLEIFMCFINALFFLLLMSCKTKRRFSWHMAYCLDGRRFDSRLGRGFGRSKVQFPVGARFSIPAQRSHEAHLASCAMGTGVSGLDIGFVTHPIITPRWESTAVPHLHSVPSRNAVGKSFNLSRHIFKN